MNHRTEPKIDVRRRAGHARRKHNGRRRRTWVRVETDLETYVGCLLSSGGRNALEDVLADGRAYLPLWDASFDGQPDAPEEYVALYKGAIRSVKVIGRPESATESSSGR